MPKITNKVALEEHFSASALDTSIKDVAFFDPDVLCSIEVSLPEVSEPRAQVMDQASIAIAVLSHTAPDVQAMQDAELAVGLAQNSNDFLQSLIALTLSAFAALPT